jgi:hypothetical protein
MSADRGLFGFRKLTKEERERALADPGPSWREWLASSFAKTYLGLAFFIADGIVIASWFQPRLNVVGLVGSTLGAVYLEYLAWQYLWFEPVVEDEAPLHPHPDDVPPMRAALRKVFHPFRIGRWIPTGARHGPRLDGADQGPDPKEFL